MVNTQEPIVIRWVMDVSVRVGIRSGGKTSPTLVFEDSHGEWRVVGPSTYETQKWHDSLRASGAEHGEIKTLKPGWSESSRVSFCACGGSLFGT